MISRTKTTSGLRRRSFLEGVLLSGAAIAGSAPLHALATTRSSDPIVETTCGKLRGTALNGVNAFKGVPYGASTAGENRFMPPQRPASWLGVRDALRVGPQAPQTTFAQYRAAIAALPTDKRVRAQADWDFSTKLFAGGFETNSQYSEDCLVLNVWTSALNHRKRPVMVWLHGGGFETGSGGALWFDGTHLAAHHDVVLVSINHRLNVLGHLYLGAWGNGKYADSGNVGMLDIVAALQWVRDNIAAFGGDPDNVTIFGQSGGGAKVNTLMTMPAAKGLFHKAIVESGSTRFNMKSPEEATKMSETILAKLGLQPSQVDQLQKIPLDKLYAALPQDTPALFCPVIDGTVLPMIPFDPAPPAISAHVPMLIGSTRDDLVTLDDIGRSITEAELQTEVQHMINADDQTVERIISVYRQSGKYQTPNDIFLAITADYKKRIPAITQAERKLAQNAAPVFMYLFTWGIPAVGKDGALHVVELPFVFDNLDKAPGFGISPSDTLTSILARNTSEAWAMFAHTGNPSHPGLPDWKPYDLESRATMVLDRHCTLAKDPGREERQVIAALPPLIFD